MFQEQRLNKKKTSVNLYDNIRSKYYNSYDLFVFVNTYKQTKIIFKKCEY